MIHPAIAAQIEARPSASIPKGTDVEEYIQNKDGTSTLRIRCASGRIVTFTMRTAKIEDVNVDDIYNILLLECLK